MIEYLNLEISEQQKKQLTLDSNTLICYFPKKKHKHLLHSKDHPLYIGGNGGFEGKKAAISSAEIALSN